MAHTPFGYAIVDGKIEIHVREFEQLKLLIQSYLSGKSLANAANDSGINRSHGGITRILTDERYLGNGIFPRLISKSQFEQLKEERFKRAKKLGRLNRTKEKNHLHHHSHLQSKKWKTNTTIQLNKQNMYTA
ncbi:MULTISPECIES: recombinase [Allobacillus]|uniref:Recombinase n=1 Tax=Allobacillus salarius TaxID=1955272 RepID=A0A556PA58_9BACI|nr:recombinase [Allobacillus salarius]TSJ61253.1 recombinase [Allobacillus salarius]